MNAKKGDKKGEAIQVAMIRTYEIERVIMIALRTLSMMAWDQATVLFNCPQSSFVHSVFPSLGNQFIISYHVIA